MIDKSDLFKSKNETIQLNQRVASFYLSFNGIFSAKAKKTSLIFIATHSDFLLKECDYIIAL